MAEVEEEEKYVRMPRVTVSLVFKMTSCTLCGIEFNRLQRHMKNKHNSFNTNEIMIKMSPRLLTFQHPFSMMVTGPIRSGKTEWTRKLLLCSLGQPPPERMVFWTMAAPVRRPSEENSMYRIYTGYPTLFR